MEQEFDFERVERALSAAREASKAGDHSLWCEIPLPPDGVRLGRATGEQILQAASRRRPIFAFALPVAPSAGWDELTEGYR